MTEKFTQKNIPKDWARMQLADLCSIKKGEQLNRSELTDTGDYPALNGGISPSGYTDTWNTEANTITISEGGNSCGYVNFFVTKFWCGGHCYALQQIKEMVDNKFLYQALKFQQSSLMKLRVGSGLPNIQRKGLEEFKVIVPPLHEQKKIAEILEAIDEEIQKTNKIISTTEKMKKGLMQELFTHGIGHTKFKKTEIGKSPETWNIVNLLNVTKIANGQVDPRQEPYSDMILLAPNHIESNSGRILEKVTAKDQQAISGKFLVEEGDIIYSKIRPYLKKVTIADGACLCSADMYPIKATKGLDNKFLFHILLSDQFTNFANSNSGRTGIPKINREEFGNYRFALPPVGEQKKITTILSSVDEKISVSQQLIAKLALLKKGLTQDLLSGRVRVLN